MKIQGRCRVCGRDFPIDLLLMEPETAGRCPFCATPLDQHYGALLVEALRKLQQAGTLIERTLEEASRLAPNLELDASTILGPIGDALGARARASAERKATEDAAAAERAG